MSADSPRRPGPRGNRPAGVPGCGQLVIPQPVNDRSIIDSVAGFINEVVPQAYTSTIPGENKESVLWAHFESADLNEASLVGDGVSDTALPLVLVLGYASGVQVWSVAANGEASELISWTQGNIKTFRFLPSPAANTVRNPDAFVNKRPLVALCDSAGPGPPYCSINFISLRCGDQIKSIKFKSQVCDVVANRRSVVVTFNERIAVFDACTLEDRLSVTTCYPSPGPNPNPVALGSRWLAYAEKKLISWQRSSGGAAGVGSQSYTATVLHAAQTLSRGLRGLSETVASSLTGPRGGITGGITGGSLGSSPPLQNGTDHHTPGVVTVLDLEGPGRRSGAEENSLLADHFVSHFVAHTEAIVAMAFDPSGLLLLTADRRGHDFHVYRLHPHPGGSSLSAAHHLYVLHRGDTTAKVQDIAFSCDSRWVAVSTLRGTSHVFPLTPYGGAVGVRTHGSPHVVNRLSRFHRSAGLSADGRSSPVPSPEALPCLPSGPQANPRMPPYPHPTVQSPLAQLRQPHHPAIAPSGSMDVALRVCATFAAPRAWLLDGARETNRAASRRAVDSLFIMACHGNLLQYDLEPKPVSVVPREKICDDTPIELDVEERAQWTLQRSPQGTEIAPPLSPGSILLNNMSVNSPNSERTVQPIEDRWLSQVEIVTHAGPHRRLWMGPQITFKTLAATGSTPVGITDCEIDTARGYVCRPGSPLSSRPARSEPVNMPASSRPVVPVLIESGSSSTSKRKGRQLVARGDSLHAGVLSNSNNFQNYEQPPYLLNVSGDLGDDVWVGPGESRLREDLADAMLESPGVPHRDKGQRCSLSGQVGSEDESDIKRNAGTTRGPVCRVVNPGGVELVMSSDGEEEAASSTPPDESTLRVSVMTIAAAELLRKNTKSPVSPVAVPLQLTMTPSLRIHYQEQPPDLVVQNEVAKMEVEVASIQKTEESSLAAPKRSWSSIVSATAKSKSQKTKKNFQADDEEKKILKEEITGKKRGSKKKAEQDKMRDSPKKVVEEEKHQREEPPGEEEELDVEEVTPVEKYFTCPDENRPAFECAIPALEKKEKLVQQLLEEEELEIARHEEVMRDYLLLLAASEHNSDEEPETSALDELDEEEQEYKRRPDDLSLSTIDDNEYVEAENEVSYFCINERGRVINELEECDSFYLDAHKAVQEVLEEKVQSVQEENESPVREDLEVAGCGYANPLVEALASAPVDISRRHRRQKKKRR